MLNIAKVESLISDHGWSNSYFCRLFNKNSGWIRDWKRGRGLPDENTLQDIADKLDTTVDYLTDKTEQKNKPATESDRPDAYEKRSSDLMKLVPEGQRELFLGMIEGALRSQGLLK